MPRCSWRSFARHSVAWRSGPGPIATKAIPTTEAVTAAETITTAEPVAAKAIATAEAVTLAAKAGVDPAACLAGLNSGSGRSAVSEVNFPEWILSGRFDSGFTSGLMRKDLRLACDAASGLELDLELLQRVVEGWHADSTRPADGDDFNHITSPILAQAGIDFVQSSASDEEISA